MLLCEKPLEVIKCKKLLHPWYLCVLNRNIKGKVDVLKRLGLFGSVLNGPSHFQPLAGGNRAFIMNVQFESANEVANICSQSLSRYNAYLPSMLAQRGKVAC